MVSTMEPNILISSEEVKQLLTAWQGYACVVALDLKTDADHDTDKKVTMNDLILWACPLDRE